MNLKNLRLPGWAAGLVVTAAFLAGMALVQFSTPNMPDNDGFYHIKLAYLMRTQGLLPKFPWLPLTILNQREFYDHHFLFHLALVPFTFGDLRLGAKWAAVIFSSFAFFCVWWLLRGQRILLAPLWAVGLLALSESFLFRMSITRAQSLSLGVLALGMHWMLTNRYRWLVPLAFIYVWLYDAFPLLIALAFLYALAILVTEHRLEWRPLAFACLGTGLGLGINLYFPHNLVFIFRHLLPKLADATSVSVGNEWFPYRTTQLLENSLLALVAYAAGIFALGIHRERMDARTTFSLLATFLFGLMLFQARRFIEYFPAFALIFAAFAWSPILTGVGQPIPASRAAFFQKPARKQWAALVLSLILVPGIWITLKAAQTSIQGAKPYQLYARAAGWLQENTPPGERVFQTDWDDFPRLFFYNTHNTYLVGLDPTYMQLYDAGLYDQWVKITEGKVNPPSESIENQFGSRFVFSDLGHQNFLESAANDPRLKEVYRDDEAVIFQVIQPGQ